MRIELPDGVLDALAVHAGVVDAEKSPFGQEVQRTLGWVWDAYERKGRLEPALKVLRLITDAANEFAASEIEFVKSAQHWILTYTELLAAINRLGSCNEDMSITLPRYAEWLDEIHECLKEANLLVRLVGEHAFRKNDFGGSQSVVVKSQSAVGNINMSWEQRDRRLQKAIDSLKVVINKNANNDVALRKEKPPRRKPGRPPGTVKHGGFRSFVLDLLSAADRAGGRLTFTKKSPETGSLTQTLELLAPFCPDGFIPRKVLPASRLAEICANWRRAKNRGGGKIVRQAASAR